jgi:hypothetical protein
MYCTNAREAALLLDQFLQDLTFIDGREKERVVVEDELQIYGSLGVGGAFERAFGDRVNYCIEVVSIYAEHFWRLGYLQVGRLLENAEWSALAVGLADRVEERDLRRSEVESAYGRPSVDLDGHVWCFACEDFGERWIYFDFHCQDASRYLEGLGRYEVTRDPDPLLRAVRSYTAQPEMILSLYGKVLNAGPGWWIGGSSKRFPKVIHDLVKDE